MRTRIPAALVAVIAGALPAVVLPPAAPPASAADAPAAVDPPDDGAAGIVTRFVAHPDRMLLADLETSLREPHGVSTDQFGGVFVADTGNHRVLQFDPGGRLVFEYGGYGWDRGRLSRPTDVSAREGFRLFVVDTGNDRIQSFSITDTSTEGVVFPFGAGSGFGGEELVRPYRMDIDAEGRIYVSDELCHCVWIFTPTGELASKLGGLGSEDARFDRPSGVAVSTRGQDVYIADSGNRRIQVFDSIGNWKASWGGPDQDLFGDPRGIDLGPDGNVYVADAEAALVRVLTPRGIPLFSFGGPGGGPGTFDTPVDVAVDTEGRVWVVDREREVVQAFRIERVAGER